MAPTENPHTAILPRPTGAGAHCPDIWHAETAEAIAELCRQEAEALGGPFYDGDTEFRRCPLCGCTVSADESPCRVDYGHCGVIDLFHAGAPCSP